MSITTHFLFQIFTHKYLNEMLSLLRYFKEVYFPFSRSFVYPGLWTPDLLYASHWFIIISMTTLNTLEGTVTLIILQSKVGHIKRYKYARIWIHVSSLPKFFHLNILAYKIAIKSHPTKSRVLYLAFICPISFLHMSNLLTISPLFWEKSSLPELPNLSGGLQNYSNSILLLSGLWRQLPKNQPSFLGSLQTIFKSSPEE